MPEKWNPDAGPWPETPPEDLREMHEENGSWRRSQQVAAYLRRLTHDGRGLLRFSGVRKMLEQIATEVEKGDTLP